MARQLSLSNLQELLGDDVVVALEPSGQWVFDPKTGESGRADGKFFAVRPVDRGGYYQLALVEEPSVHKPKDDSPRVVGQVVVEVNSNWRVRVRTAKGLNGPVVELAPSSMSKGELRDGRFGPVFEANPQRIDGFIEPVLVEVDFPNEEGMSPWEFVEKSTDGRSITALAKLDLL
jgi:hypothetical protein